MLNEPLSEEDKILTELAVPLTEFSEENSPEMEDYQRSPFAGLSLYVDEDAESDNFEDLPPFMRPQAQEKAPSEVTPAPIQQAPKIPEQSSRISPIPQRSVAELAPEERQDTLIVGGFSLNSGDSHFKQEESMLNYLIKNALLDHVSAIHIEPMDRYIRVRYRIDGVLQQKTALPPNLGMPMLSRLKHLCALNAETTDKPQQNRVQASFNEQEFELGLATYPTVWGESMVLSLKQKQKSVNDLLRLDSIGLSPLNFWRLQKLLGQPGGLTIVTGPARSGKTTTLYAMLNALNLLSRSIVTAENPLENLIMGITQGNLNTENGGTYPDLIRAMSYLDPDVLMVSQLDTPEVVEATIEQALTGAKVLTSYHSFDTMGALLRLGIQGLESYLIASSNVAFISQRLVRKLCPHCRQTDYAPREFLDVLGLKGVQPKSFPVYWARGCAECNQMGYVGQTTLQEILVLNEELREAILEHQPAARIRELARQEGKLVTMAEDGYFKAIEGHTSLSEVQRVAFINEFDAKMPWEAENILKICKGEDPSFL